MPRRNRDPRVLFEPADNAVLANLCGQFDEHLRQIEGRLGLTISNRGNRFRLERPPAALIAGAEVLQRLALWRAASSSMRSACTWHCRSR